MTLLCAFHLFPQLHILHIILMRHSPCILYGSSRYVLVMGVGGDVVGKKRSRDEAGSSVAKALY